MNDILIIFFPFLFLIFFMALRMPVGFALIISSILELAITGKLFFFHEVPTILYSSIGHFTFLAIPFFILSAELLSGGKVIDLLFELVSVFLRRVPGGLGVVTIMVSMMLSSIQGSSAATAAALGKIGTEGMEKEGYDKGFAASLIAASGGLAIMIPPSIAMIIYGTLSDTSIGKLFYGGIIPGIIIGTALIAYVVFIAHKHKYGIEHPKVGWKQRIVLIFNALPLMFFPFIVLFGFYTGKFTATEIGTISVFYSAFIGIAVYKTINLKNIFHIIERSTKVTVSIFIIIAGAILFQHVLVLSGFLNILLDIIHNASLTPFEFLILVSAILYFLGMFMEGVALNVLTTPIVAPIAMSLGINPVHYGIILVLNIEIALISPPVGLNLFVLSAVTDIPPEDMYKAVWPILLILISCLILLIAFPQLTLFLPNLLIPKHL